MKYQVITYSVCVKYQVITYNVCVKPGYNIQCMCEIPGHNLQCMCEIPGYNLQLILLVELAVCGTSWRVLWCFVCSHWRAFFHHYYRWYTLSFGSNYQNQSLPVSQLKYVCVCVCVCVCVYYVVCIYTFCSVSCQSAPRQYVVWHMTWCRDCPLWCDKWTLP